MGSRMTTSTPRYSLLITDDDRAARETLREIFEPAGYRTLLAESGEEAIDIVMHEDVHLALLDNHLPRLTGLETMQIVREIKGLLPMILLSADQDDNLLRKALSAHAFCVLSKPVSRNVVIYVVSRALEKFYRSRLGSWNRDPRWPLPDAN
jgi:CheY-like chemotaxis protein